MMRQLSVLPGSNHLEFRCNGCGECCRNLRVALTHHDVRRLVARLRVAPAAFVDWLSADEVEMTGEPGSFVELAAGRRLMVLARAARGCVFLDAGSRCAVYDARPSDCRLFPFDVQRDADGRVVALARLDADGCGDRAGVPREAAWRELVALDDVRWRELAEYQSEVARWNRLARHRRRFGRSAGSSAEFLEFLNVAG